MKENKNKKKEWSANKKEAKRAEDTTTVKEGKQTKIQTNNKTGENKKTTQERAVIVYCAKSNKD